MFYIRCNINSDCIIQNVSNKINNPYHFYCFSFRTSAVYPLNFKDIQRIDIRACENSGALLLSRYLTAIPEYIHVRKCNVHCHRTQFSPLRIKIIGITDLMTSVTSLFPLLINQCNSNPRSCHQSSTSKYLGIVSDCIEAGLRPRCHFEDITRADFYGFVVPFANRLMEMSEQSGVPIKIRACDTMGFGVPYPGASLPRSVSGIIYGLQHYSGVPSEMLEWHGHNDFYKGVVNATTAWMYGASAVNCSLLGIGERTGNVPLEAMVFEYASLRGHLNGMNTKVITEIADYISKETGYEIPPMTPFVGENFNLTRAGIHADGMLKNHEIYNIFDTDTLLDRPPKVSVNSTSGIAGVGYWINQYRKKKGLEPVDKKSPLVRRVYDWVQEQYDEGRITIISDAELTRQTELAMEAE